MLSVLKTSQVFGRGPERGYVKSEAFCVCDIEITYISREILPFVEAYFFTSLLLFTSDTHGYPGYTASALLHFSRSHAISSVMLWTLMSSLTFFIQVFGVFLLAFFLLLYNLLELQTSPHPLFSTRGHNIWVFWFSERRWSAATRISRQLQHSAQGPVVSHPTYNGTWACHICLFISPCCVRGHASEPYSITVNAGAAAKWYPSVAF